MRKTMVQDENYLPEYCGVKFCSQPESLCFVLLVVYFFVETYIMKTKNICIRKAVDWETIPTKQMSVSAFNVPTVTFLAKDQRLHHNGFR